MSYIFCNHSAIFLQNFCNDLLYLYKYFNKDNINYKIIFIHKNMEKY